MIYKRSALLDVYNESRSQSGTTFIELMFSISILLVLTTTAAVMIRNGIDMRLAVSEQGKVTHRLQITMSKLTNDLEHIFLLDRRAVEVRYPARSTKAIFEIDPQGGGSTLRFTSLSHRSIEENSKQSDQTFITYQLEDDDQTGLKKLVRGESLWIPERFQDELPTQTLATYVKNLRVEAWNGDRWVEEWNSERGEFKDLMPHMLSIELEVYDVSPNIEEIIDNPNELPLVNVRTILYLNRSWGMKEVKQASKTIKYY